tara:strand:+ start:915 stop:1190 length:276 start_codon:yes stop_codon:yes gene_type:complete
MMRRSKMTKAELIKHMEDYEDNDDLIVLWWDSQIFESIFILHHHTMQQEGILDEPTMKIKWKEIVKEVEEHDFQQANEEVIEIIQSVIMGG